MKNLSFLLFLMLLAKNIFGQSNNSFDMVIGLEYSDRLNKEKLVDPELVENFEVFHRYGKFNYRLGFNWNNRISNKLFFKSGLRLFSVGSSSGKFDLELDPNSSFIQPTEIEFITNYFLVEIPLAARYLFNNNKISPFIEIGFSPSYFLTRNLKRITDIETSSNFGSRFDSSFNKFHFAVLVSFGMNYSLNDKLQLFAQPIYRVHLSRFTKTTNSRYYNFGAEFGVRRLLGKSRLR